MNTFYWQKVLDKIDTLKRGHCYRNGALQNRIMKPKNYVCDGGIGLFTILASGAMYPCTIAVNDKRFHGNSRREINNDIVDEIQEMVQKLITKCEGCSRYDYCTSTRCRIVNKILFRDYLEPSPVNCATQRISMELSKYAVDNSYNMASAGLIKFSIKAKSKSQSGFALCISGNKIYFCFLPHAWWVCMVIIAAEISIL